jgi:hypothetical protein
MGELVKISNEQLQEGGVGLNFGSKLFRLKPATLTINQTNTQVEGATPGKFRIYDTGEEFNDLEVVMLFEPTEARQYHLGNEIKGSLNKKPENLMCFSYDMVKPHENSKQPQAITCKSCQNSRWDNSVEPGIPPLCDVYYRVMFVDAVTQLPLRHYVRGSGKKYFEEGMQALARVFRLAQAKGEKPNIFDISFKIVVGKHKGKTGIVNYVLKVDAKSLHKLGAEEAKKFGEIYLDFINRGSDVEDEPLEQVASVDKSIDEVVEGEIVV